VEDVGPDEALKWYRIAAAGGHEEAEKTVREIEGQGE
jgi:hypothetical protein